MQQLRIEITTIKGGFCIGCLVTEGRDVTILIPESEYHKLIKDGFFLRDGQTRDSSGIFNTSAQYCAQLQPIAPHTIQP